jgi:DNA uptake protein ComE-like DNA-binding protein
VLSSVAYVNKACFHNSSWCEIRTEGDEVTVIMYARVSEVSKTMNKHSVMLYRGINCRSSIFYSRKCYLQTVSTKSTNELVFDFFNVATVEEMQIMDGCSRKKAEEIAKMRPFEDWNDLVRACKLDEQAPSGFLNYLCRTF